MKISSSLILSTALVSTLCATGGFAAAETATEATAAPQGLEEIMVTATRRTTNLQSTPVAVSAVDATLIRQASPHDLGDLAAFVPNFSATKITGFNAASFAMRGVGVTGIIVYFEAPVAVLVDDFVVPSVQTQLLDTFDVDQVEVLRGPQGTLFGKNTTGGAVVVHTKKPVLNETTGQVEASYGSFKTWDVKGAVNVPVVQDKLALRIVGGYEKSAGYMHNGATYGPTQFFGTAKFNGLSGQGNGERLGGTDVWNMRAKALLKPSDNVTALFQYEAVRDHSASPASVNTTTAASGQVLGAFGLTMGTGDPLNLAGTTNRHGLLVNIDEGHHIDVDGVYLNVDVDTTYGTVTSVSGYRNQRSRLSNSYPSVAPVAADGEVLSVFDANRADDRKTLQQELRFASKFDGPINFVAGGFYQHEKVDFCVAQLQGFREMFGPAETSAQSAFNDANGNPIFYAGGANNNPSVLCNNQRSQSEAAFGEATYKATEQLTLTAGFRYTWEKKTWQGRQQAYIQDLKGFSDPSFTWQSLGDIMNAGDFNRYPGVGIVEIQQTYKNPTWRLGAGYQFNQDLYGYFTYSRGFKSGGFNDQSGGFPNQSAELFRDSALPTRPEKADSFELGVKTESFEHRLRFNLTGFLVEYKDIQRIAVASIPLEGGGATELTKYTNAAKMEVKGIEAELTALPMEGLTLRAVLGYQDGKYKGYTDPGASYNLATNPIDRAPKWQWTLDGNYEVPLGSQYKVAFNANVVYTGSNLFTVSVTTPAWNTYLESKTLVNGSITFSDANDKYYLRVIGRNLTDKRYKTAEQVVEPLWTWALYGPPRSFAAEIGAKF